MNPRKLLSLAWAPWMKSSLYNSIAIALARVMGIAFSFMLARAYSSSEFGYVTYVLSVANLVAIVTQPFGQHVLPFIIGRYHDDEEQFKHIMNNVWTIALIFLVLTFIIAIPVLQLLDRFSWELMTVFFGITVFYTYHGLSTGFLSSSRFLTAYLGSNFMQLVLIAIAVYGFKAETVVPSIYIYGLSYLLPLTILVIFFPLPAHFGIAIDLSIIRRILRTFAPILMSHGLFVIHFAADVILLEYFTTESIVGTYGLTKTLVSAFGFIPSGIALVLLPQIANPKTTNRMQMLVRSVTFATAINVVAAVFFLALYPWVIKTFFNEEYYIGITFAIIMSIESILVSIHGLSFAGLAGAEKTYIDTISRIVMVVGIIVAGILLIPTYEAIGAAWAALISVAAGMSIHTIYVIQRIRLRRASATVNADNIDNTDNTE